MFRGMIAKVCQTGLRCERFEQAGTGAAGLELCRAMLPDVVLLDLDLPDFYGLDLIPGLRAASPQTKIIVLSAHAEDYVIHRCLQLEVDGFVDKNDEPEEIIVKAIESVLAGKTYLSSVVSRVRSFMREDPKAFTKLLSDREQQLIGFFGRGMSEAEIASKTGISPATVVRHQRNIMGKLGIHTAADLRQYAIVRGFSPPPRMGPQEAARH